ncbi:MAG: hypothetical protein ACLTH0_11380 [Blautia producta]
MCIETNCDRKERMKYTKRAAEIVSSLSLHEKVSLMSGNMSFHEVRSAIRKKGKAHYNEIPYQAGGIREKGIPSVLLWMEQEVLYAEKGITFAFRWR